MIHPCDGRTDKQTDGRAIAYMRYSIYAVARKNDYLFQSCQLHSVQLLQYHPDLSKHNKLQFVRSHVAKTVLTCYSVLRQLRTIRRSVSRSVLQALAAGVVSCPLVAGLRQFDTRRRFILSLVMAAVNDERRHSAHLFLVKIPAHHSAPSSAVLVYKCQHESAYLADELCQVAAVEARQ